MTDRLAGLPGMPPVNTAVPHTMSRQRPNAAATRVAHRFGHPGISVLVHITNRGDNSTASTSATVLAAGELLAEINPSTAATGSVGKHTAVSTPPVGATHTARSGTAAGAEQGPAAGTQNAPARSRQPRPHRSTNPHTPNSSPRCRTSTHRVARDYNPRPAHDQYVTGNHPQGKEKTCATRSPAHYGQPIISSPAIR